jgi:hypothetical protein
MSPHDMRVQTQKGIDSTRSQLRLWKATDNQHHAPTALLTAQRARWTSVPVWTGTEILAFTGTRSPDRETRIPSTLKQECVGPEASERLKN